MCRRMRQNNNGSETWISACTRRGQELSSAAGGSFLIPTALLINNYSQTTEQNSVLRLVLYSTTGGARNSSLACP